jgi:recombinational DNA repair ATPase RecF
MTIHEISFVGFRGLPHNSVATKGRSLLIVGGNGTGKSSLVDGIDFLFAGSVNRFHGTDGTGKLKHDRAVTHAKGSSAPSVTVTCAGGSMVTRRLGDQSPTIQGAVAQAFHDAHDSAGQFILRRKNLLGFIEAKDSDRYSRFIQLLGLDHVDRLQREVNSASKSAKDAEKASSLKLSTAVRQLAYANTVPNDIATLLQNYRAAGAVLGEKGPPKISLDVLATAPPTPRKAGAASERTKLEAVASALDRTREAARVAAELGEAYKEAAEAAVDAGASVDPRERDVVRASTQYFDAHSEATDCPTCEQELPSKVDIVLGRLRERSLAYERLEAAEQGLARARSTYRSAVDTTVANMSVASALTTSFYEKERNDLEAARAAVSEARKASPPQKLESVAVELTSLAAVVDAFEQVAELARRQLEKIVAVDDSRDAAARFMNAVDSASVVLSNLDREATQDLRAVELLDHVRAAFIDARESFVQQYFDRIATRVLNYYSRLHGGTSEARDVSLKAQRIGAGSLKLAIDFLGLQDNVDPREHLSEGHLDSLGLSLFLATVKEMREPKTVLVLDDVLTSIDRDHRARVAELLRDEFAEYQLVVTTHDHSWADRLQGIFSVTSLGPKFWNRIDYDGWDIDVGPIISNRKASWDRLRTHPSNESLADLGGVLRDVFEDFVQRVADKIAFKVPYSYSGYYEAGTFLSRKFPEELGKQLRKLSPDEKTEIDDQLGRVFGDPKLTNYLVHHSEQRLDIPDGELRDFVASLDALRTRCATHKLLAGGL